MAALLPLLLLIPLWLLLVRPQQRRVRAQRAMVLSLQQGDDVLTSAGIYGTIIDLDDEVVTLEVAEGVRLRIARMAIGRRLTPHPEDFGTEAPPPPPAIEDEADQPVPPPADEQ